MPSPAICIIIRQLEERDDPDGALFSNVFERIKELDKLRDEKQARLAALTNDRTAANDPSSLDLVEELLTADADTLRSAPEAILRRLFDAFQLRVTYDHRTGHAVCRVVVRGDTVPAANAALQAAHGPHDSLSAADGIDMADGVGSAPDGQQERLHRRGGRFPAAWRSRLSALRTMTRLSWVRRCCSATATPKSGARGTGDEVATAGPGTPRRRGPTGG